MPRRAASGRIGAGPAGRGESESAPVRCSKNARRAGRRSWSPPREVRPEGRAGFASSGEAKELRRFDALTQHVDNARRGQA